MSAPAHELQVTEYKEINPMFWMNSPTGLLNRRALMGKLGRAIERTTRKRAGNAGLLFDLSNFKYINDTQGHDAGDRVLKKLAAALRRTTRSYDFVARLVGDEFVVWLVNGDKETARHRAVAILGSSCMLAEVVSLDPAKKLGVSIGIFIFNADHPESAQELV
jgi:diguanylate cyclase (GGDEF)-like protein